MGTGMNVQDKLVALHNVDPTYKPSEMEQRNGRILRQGNELFKRDPANFKVRILNYVTQGREQKFGFDAYMWQLNKAKAKIIADFFKGKLEKRNLKLDLDQTVLSATEFMATATGNPQIIEFGKVTAELEEMRLAQEGWEQAQREAEWNHADYVGRLASWEQQLAKDERIWKGATPYEPGTPLVFTPAEEPTEVDSFSRPRVPVAPKKEGEEAPKEIVGFKAIGEHLIEVAKRHSTETDDRLANVPYHFRPVKLGTFRGVALWMELQGKQRELFLTLRPLDAEPSSFYNKHADMDVNYTVVSVGMLRSDAKAKSGTAWRDPVGMIRCSTTASTKPSPGSGSRTTSRKSRRRSSRPTPSWRPTSTRKPSCRRFNCATTSWRQNSATTRATSNRM